MATMMRGRHMMTPARMRALHNAQLASARKRKGTGKKRLSPRTKRNLKRVAIGAAIVGVGAASVALKNPSGVRKNVNRVKTVHYKHRQIRTGKRIARAQHVDRQIVNRNAKTFLKYKNAHPDRFKRHQAFGPRR